MNEGVEEEGAEGALEKEDGGGRRDEEGKNGERKKTMINES